MASRSEIRALELFCGIGGFAAAVAGSKVRVVGALDQSPVALSVYRLNFPDHDARQTDLERIGAGELASFGADPWWLSPPCQPYSVRGRGLDLADPRARSLVRVLECLAALPGELLPRHLALENVPGFAPRELARLLHFPPSFHFPEALPLRKRWQLLGNSLSVAAAREVLRDLPEA